MKLQVKSW